MPLYEPPPPTLTRTLVRITSDQYHRMIEEGIIPEDSSTELLNGLIVTKDRADSEEDGIGHGASHRLAVRLLMKLAARIDSDSRHFQVQLPILLAIDNEPEPDGAVIIGNDQKYADHLPTPADVACFIEVAASSLERDRADKLPMCAAAGIPQYIIVNLRENVVEVYTQPDTLKRTYAKTAIVSKGQTFHLNLGEGESLEVRAGDVLP